MTAKSEQGHSQAREGHVSIITVIWSEWVVPSMLLVGQALRRALASASQMELWA